ncbi:MAG: dihydrodipicolinate synthase family protein [Brachymonas sp.]
MTTDQHVISGLWPALLTPIQEDGSVDVPRMLAHGKLMLAAGSDGLTLFGTTGEGTSFTVAQRQAVAQAFVEAGIPANQLVLNLSALSRDDAVDLAVHGMRLGMKAGLLMPPFYYNGQHDAGIVQYYSEVIAHAKQREPQGNLQIILYHFPGLCGIAISHAVIKELMQKHPREVIGIKDSSADVAHSKTLAQSFPRLSVLVGCEPDVMPTQLVGGAGSICGLANIAPKLMRRMMDAPAAVSAQDDAQMRALLAVLSMRPNMPFVSVYKAMLAQQTGDQAWLRVRAPLTPLSAQELADVQRAAQPCLPQP